MGKALLDAARLRAGDPLEGSDLDAAVRVLVHARIPLLLTTDGHVAQVTRADVEKAVSQVPDAAWMTAYAEHCRRPSTSISAPSSSDPLQTQRGLAGYASFVLETLRALPPARTSSARVRG